VVSLLLEKGLRVRALARNEQKALAMLSGGKKPDPATSRLELVTADIKDATSLTPEIMEGVVAVVGCTAAIVQPKSGDSEDRAKYYQVRCEEGREGGTGGTEGRFSVFAF